MDLPYLSFWQLFPRILRRLEYDYLISQYYQMLRSFKNLYIRKNYLDRFNNFRAFLDIKLGYNLENST